MKKLCRLCLLLICPALFAQTPPTVPPPTEDQEAEMIAAIREAALSWESKLPDFTCNRVSRREARLEAVPAPATTAARPGPLQPSDMIEERLTWSDHKESDVVVSANGVPVASGATSPKDAMPVAGFVRMLTGIFSDTAHTEFKWKALMGLRGMPVEVFEYKVAKENSPEELTAGTSRITVGYHGIFYADRFTGRVMGVTFQAEIPADFPLQDVRRIFEFGQVVIGGQFFLMPLQSQAQERGSLDLYLLQHDKPGGKSPQVMTHYTTDFLSCRTYTAEAAPKPGQ